MQEQPSTNTQRWSVELERGVILFRVMGDLDDEAGVQSALRFASLVRGRVHFLADLRELKNYTRVARNAWQTALSEARPNLARVDIVGLSAIGRMAAAAVFLAAGIRGSFYDSLDDFHARTRSDAL